MNVRKKNPAGILLTVILIAALLTVCLELGLSYLRPDTPGSIPKHLSHFGIMFALLGSAVLLCLFCPPFKKLWAWIDEHILTQETRPIAIDIIYAVIAGLMLLHHFYVLLYYPTIPAGATKFAPVWIIIAALTIILGKSWNNVSFRLAAIYLVFSFERLYIKNSNITSNDIVYFISAIYAFFICLGIFSTLRPSIRKPFLNMLCMLFAIGTLAICIPGLYTSWTGIKLLNLVGTKVFVHRGRLGIFTGSTVTAGYVGCCCLMTLIGFSVSHHKFIKVFYSLVSLIALITNSLTDTRSSFLMLAFMIASMLCVSIWTQYRNKRDTDASSKKVILIITSLILCFGISFYYCVEGQRILATTFIDARDSSNMIISTARAEETIEANTSTPSLDFSQRDVWVSEDMDIIDTLHGRSEIWEKGFHYILNHTETLIYGQSVDGAVTSVIERPDHSHNILLQTLLEGGIPSLLVYLSLILYGAFHAFRLWNRRSVPFWQRVLPLPVFSILLWEMAECLTHFSYGHPPMTLFWFFLGTTITVSKSLGKAPKTKEIPATEAGE